MPELVYQTWERITGRPWSDAAKGGFTDGSYDANIDLQRRLLEGWDPYAKPAAKKPAAKKAAPKAATDMSLQIDPGMWERIQEELMLIEMERIRVQEEAAAEQAAQLRRTTELQYATSPIDYVAYEMYKRELEEGGWEPMGDVQSDEDIQAMMAQLVGGVGSLVGEFGVELPTAGQWSRSQFQDVAQSERDILSSFLRAGVETPGGADVTIDPGDYFRRMAEGFVPTLAGAGPTRYR